MLNCIIVDDEPKAIGIITRCIENIQFLTLSSSFRNAEDALGYLQSHSVDLIFLDINMPGTSGLELARLIPDNTRIIFTTAYHEYACEGFELNAIDYLLKPITFARFSKAVHKITELDPFRSKINLGNAPLVKEATNARNSDYLLFKSGTALHKIFKDHILYFEKDGNYFKIYLRDKTLIIRMNFADLQEYLSTNQFSRVHKSYIVNLNQIDRIDTWSVFIKNTEIPISQNYKQEFLQTVKEVFGK